VTSLDAADSSQPHWHLLRDGLAWRELEDELMVFCGRSGATHRLLGAEAWLLERLLQGPATTAELIVEVREYAAAGSEAEADATIRGALAAFERFGLATAGVAPS
jgi:PqqD family protein of HPr-rel-A system